MIEKKLSKGATDKRREIVTRPCIQNTTGRSFFDPNSPGAKTLTDVAILVSHPFFTRRKERNVLQKQTIFTGIWRCPMFKLLHSPRTHGPIGAGIPKRCLCRSPNRSLPTLYWLLCRLLHPQRRSRWLRRNPPQRPRRRGSVAYA